MKGRTTRGELLAIMRKKFPGDEQERTYLQLLLEGQLKSAIKGNTEAAKLLLRLSSMGALAEAAKPRKRKTVRGAPDE